MNKTTKFSAAMLALGIALALSPALRAQETPAPQAPGAQTPGMQDHGRMMGTDMQGMMRMMGQMSQMMDQCSRMMQSMTDRQGSPTPNQR